MEANRVSDIDNINQKGRGNENMEHKISCGSHDLRRNDQTCIIQVIIIGEWWGGRGSSWRNWREWVFA